ncbi:MAG TPA: dipeptide/oligopeptide/nickel ABC transporter permease/ATP-binding protein [Conexibacter sp.]|jgi:peptide/nickel transport system permease protein
MSLDATDVATMQTSVSRGRARTSLGTLWQDKAAFFGAAFLLILLIAAIFAPLVAPHEPTAVDLFNRTKPPVWSGGTWSYPLGTDSLGRDVLSRLIYGARVSLLIGVSVVLVSGTVGTFLGLLAGYKGGRWDLVIMRLADAQLAFPGLLLVLLVLTFLGSSIPVIIGVVAVYGWMIYARMIRSLVLQLRESPAIQAAELLGAGTPRILFKHLLPMLYSALLTQAILELARVVLVEASLSYLGLGVQPPNASWGLMVAENQGDLQDAWWTVTFPGVALALTVLAMNLLANWLRVQTDPQQRQRRFALGSMKRNRRGAGFQTGGDAAAVTAVTAERGVHPLVSVKDLEVRFHSLEGEVPAVRGASFDIRPGETLGIVGESGSGKSTTALALMDLIPPPGRVERARLAWEGEELDRRRLHRLRGSEIAMIFQDPMTSLNPLVPIGRQVGEVLVKHKGMSAQASRRRAEELFELVGIPSPKERLDQFPHELSGGLRQRVMIATALATEPKLVIADEPTTALDATIQAQILEIIRGLQQRLGLSMLLITHDLGVVARVCDRVLVMYGGHIVEEAPVDELFETPRHRYTQALLAAVPRVDHGRGRLATIPGHPPGRLEAVAGCPFAPRCEHASEQCAAMPPMAADGARRFACWHPTVEELVAR